MTPDPRSSWSPPPGQSLPPAAPPSPDPSLSPSLPTAAPGPPSWQGGKSEPTLKRLVPGVGVGDSIFHLKAELLTSSKLILTDRPPCYPSKVPKHFRVMADSFRGSPTAGTPHPRSTLFSVTGSRTQNQEILHS